MRLVVQRVSSAAVAVAGERIAGIGAGLLVLAGVGRDDSDEAARRLAAKVAALRIFGDDEVGVPLGQGRAGVPLGQGRARMNRSLIDVGGEALVVSQFTLYADTRKGYRPSFVGAARPELAVGILEAFVAGLRSAGLAVAEGRFGAHMEVSLVNDGPVTILLEG
ncbi:MAG TPA: D-aminoacyl-tRNA deacylase [Actinomycetota bacterium]|nr:D-aminoacyl-tRNA deacylase [Actinomycetota bacterium]